VRKVADALNESRKAVNGSRILILGVAYKKDIDDLRESPALEIIRLLQQRGAEVRYHDPFCQEIADDGHTMIANLPMYSVDLTDEALSSADAVVIVTDHTAIDYARVASLAPVVVDTRGVLGSGAEGERVIGLSGGARGSLELLSTMRQSA
jgi:UDP-N-acetyl-D-glucosamine dehydrogenase